MRRSIACLLAWFGFGLLAPAARGDLAPIAPQPKKIAIKIEIDENAKVSRLLVPMSAAANPIRPRPVPLPNAEPKVVPPNLNPKFENEGEDAVEAPRSNFQLIAAGCALTLGLMFGGLWLARKRSPRVLALLIASGAVLAAGSMVLANRAPAPVEKTPPPVVSNLPVAFDGELQIEFLPPRGGDAARLILTKADYEKLKEKPKAPEAKPASN